MCEETLLYIRGSNCGSTVKRWNVTSCEEIHLNNMKNSYQDQTGSEQRRQARFLPTRTFVCSPLKSGGTRTADALGSVALQCQIIWDESAVWTSSQHPTFPRLPLSPSSGLNVTSDTAAPSIYA
jgi:hypothetical protein